MAATFDLPAVRNFAARLDTEVRTCENDEGDVCMTLEAVITYYTRLCYEYERFVREWAEAVFTGRVPFHQDAENLLREKGDNLLMAAEQAAFAGRSILYPCFAFRDLELLQRNVAVIRGFLATWVSPRLSVGPAPRVKPPEAAERQIAERVNALTVPRA